MSSISLCVCVCVCVYMSVCERLVRNENIINHSLKIEEKVTYKLKNHEKKEEVTET